VQSPRGARERAGVDDCDDETKVPDFNVHGRSRSVSSAGATLAGPRLPRQQQGKARERQHPNGLTSAVRICCRLRLWPCIEIVQLQVERISLPFTSEWRQVLVPNTVPGDS
jgi:hypothetical protein